MEKLALAAQVVGAAAAGVGVYLLGGLAWTLVVAGAAVVVIATLAEMRGA